MIDLQRVNLNSCQFGDNVQQDGFAIEHQRFSTMANH